MKQADSDRVIQYVKSAIENHELLPGDRLPAERKLAEMLGVSRNTVRQSLQKLDLYGIVTTMPQSGTIISSFSKQQLDLLLNNALHIGSYDFESLMSERILLEAEALMLCSINHTAQDMEDIVNAFTEYERNMNTDRRQETDFNFHLTISKGAHNPVIHSMLLTIIPDTLKYYERWRLCRGSEIRTRQEHREMVDFISSNQTENARALIERHLLHPRMLAK